MPCYHPLTAYQCQQSKLIAFNPTKYRDSRMLKLPCGQCIGCRDRRARDWAIRCMHEASLYSRNCFITLTYDDVHLPTSRSLVYEDFQKFMKRLRFSFKGHQALPDGTFPIRFYMCGEYGPKLGRPHFHALIFNFDFDDRKLWTVRNKIPLYRSAVLEQLWPFGFSSVGNVTFQSAAYVARYINAKITGQMADDHYAVVDPDTGELVSFRVPEFNKMSLKPGIGAGWLDKFKSDVFPHDYIISSGSKLPVPRYYNKKFQCSNPFEWDEVSHQRFISSKKFVDDNTPERLAVRKQVHLARLSRLKRDLN